MKVPTAFLLSLVVTSVETLISLSSFNKNMEVSAPVDRFMSSVKAEDSGNLRSPIYIEGKIKLPT
ncbi:hypothetical protein SDC9_112772 [bioreactor metagenome]|uniref:Uncharacterized protein n=1 Tax=bioreactor metagenome TaxID=1076179 RepID=A0A645BL82_9ZZZZ